MRTRNEIQNDRINTSTVEFTTDKADRIIIELLLDIRQILNQAEIKAPIPEHYHVWKNVSYGPTDINKDTICSICGISKY